MGAAMFNSVLKMSSSSAEKQATSDRRQENAEPSSSTQGSPRAAARALHATRYDTVRYDTAMAPSPENRAASSLLMSCSTPMTVPEGLRSQAATDTFPYHTHTASHTTTWSIKPQHTTTRNTNRKQYPTPHHTAPPHTNNTFISRNATPPHTNNNTP